MRIASCSRRAVLALAGVTLVIALVYARTPRQADASSAPSMAIGDSPEWTTSRESLESIVVRTRARVGADPGDGEAAVLLADALIRSARVAGDASLAIEAERVVRSTLSHAPADYGARRMLGVVLLAQHRFADARDAAEEARQVRPADAWNYAVLGDALLELGRYEEAFAAFDEMNRRRPDPAGYARVAYARELQGDIAGAIETMQMASDGTGANDPEAQAWYQAQLGHLFLLDGQPQAAERAFAEADHIFPGHPYAVLGRIRGQIARREYRQAHTALARAGDTPETWALRGDIARRLGDGGAAERAYREAVRLEREGWAHEEPQPAALARMLAERRLDVTEAVALAERAVAGRRDIHTMDALAWSYFQAGRVDEAEKAMAEALRTGSRDPRLRCHARAIAEARREPSTADALLCDPLDLAASPAVVVAAGR
jgi:tetratricopeptide (TPR) repeat protein